MVKARPLFGLVFMPGLELGVTKDRCDVLESRFNRQGALRLATLRTGAKSEPPEAFLLLPASRFGLRERWKSALEQRCAMGCSASHEKGSFEIT